GIGDNLSFGLTAKLRESWDGGDPVNKCGDLYGAGERSGTVISIGFGVAHLGKNLLAQGGRSLAKGLGRLAWDPRSWGSVRREYSLATGGLKNVGQSLHHWLFPQRWGWVTEGFRNAGFNYLPLSAGFNSWMNGSTALRTGVEWGLKGVIGGIY